MKISNKLSNLDFIQLQKIMMENFKPGAGTMFFLKYVVNFLYSFAVFTGMYYILKVHGKYDNWIIPAIVGVIMFALLIIFFDRIYKKRMDKAIVKYYIKQNLDIERDIDIDDEGFTVDDHKNEPRVYKWDMFKKAYRDLKNFYFMANEVREGVVVKYEGLSEDETKGLFEIVEKHFSDIEVR